MSESSGNENVKDEAKGNITWQYDEGWETPLITYGPREDSRFGALDRALVAKDLVCRVGSDSYVFLDTSNSWCNLASYELMIRICGVMEINNATVNYDKSLKPYVRYIARRCAAKLASPIPTSVCIGTRRVEVFMEENGDLLFETSRPLVTLPPRLDKTGRVATLSIKPVTHTCVPKSFSFPGVGKIIRYISPLYENSIDLATVMWHIGNCVVDPISRPTTLLLLGPGGSGKSQTIKVIEQTLVGCCGIIPDGTLTIKGEKVPEAVAEVIVSNRMAVCYDANLVTNAINMTVLKNISGSDNIRVGTIACKAECSLTVAANAAMDPLSTTEYTSDAIMRRIVSMIMRVDAHAIGHEDPPSDYMQYADFLCACIHVRMRHDQMPVSTISLLSTLCGSRIDAALQALRVVARPTTDIDAVASATILGILLETDASKVAYAAKLISKYHYVSCSIGTGIRGLVPRN